MEDKFFEEGDEETKVGEAAMDEIEISLELIFFLLFDYRGLVEGFIERKQTSMVYIGKQQMCNANTTAQLNKQHSDVGDQEGAHAAAT